MEYDKDKVMELLQDKLGWVYYGENIMVYTRFFQGYILPTKFKIKRVGHLSDLIRSGQLSRENALKELSPEGYNADMKNIDIDL
jgi:DNA-binding phage protein